MNEGITIHSGNFEDEVVRSPIPVILDFWAAWCGSCKMLNFTLNQLAEEFAGRIKIGKVNVEEETLLAEQHQVITLPTLAVYQGGALVHKHAGALPKPRIAALIQDMIAAEG
ncbi:MAG: thiol reductase thioredoxin [Treponema sp.]|jgi:thioredoxin 1|nr:thiol reductase thioredoxin [Treponema sp.]